MNTLQHTYITVEDHWSDKSVRALSSFRVLFYIADKKKRSTNTDVFGYENSIAYTIPYQLSKTNELTGGELSVRTLSAFGGLFPLTKSMTVREDKVERTYGNLIAWTIVSTVKDHESYTSASALSRRFAVLLLSSISGTSKKTNECRRIDVWRHCRIICQRPRNQRVCVRALSRSSEVFEPLLRARLWHADYIVDERSLLRILVHDATVPLRSNMWLD